MVKWELLFSNQWELYLNQLEMFKPTLAQKLTAAGYDGNTVEFLNPRAMNSVYLYPKIQVMKNNKIHILSSNPDAVYL